ncbi:MAG: hypothetical protein K2Q26_06365 [Bdellovibrionales bacterium]|nr:hypothetical protein [Bdellovibrionales bacterium]
MKHLLLITTLVFVFGCAKNRGIEPLRPNVTEDWQSKRDFTGAGAERDIYFFKITSVKNSNDGGFTFVGFETDMRVGYFDFTKDKLIFKNIQGQYKGRESTVSASPILLQWPITHHEAQLQTIDGKTTNKEIDDDRKEWFQKNSFKINFALPDVTEENTFFTGDSCWQPLSRRRVDGSVQTEPGYISFVVEVLYRRMCPGMQEYQNGNSNYTVQYRYSFRKMETKDDYKPWAYESELDPKMRKFGYFQSIKEDMNPIDGRVKNVFLINRWHPEKTHNFFFTKGFPEHYKPIFYDIFDKTNEVFIKAGLKIRFKLNENTGIDGKVKEFGDLRYSFVNVVEEMDPSAPLGYGPSNANPFTGEILAANLNVWTGMLKYYMKVLELSASRFPNKYETSDLYKKMEALLNEGGARNWGTNWDPQSEIGSFYEHMISKTTYGFPGANGFTRLEDSMVPVQVVVDKARPLEGPLVEKMLPMNETWLKHLYAPVSAGQNTFIRPRLIAYEPLEEQPLFKALFDRNPASRRPDLAAMKMLSGAIKDYEAQQLKLASMNLRGHCAMDMQEALVGVDNLLIAGYSTQELTERILYRVGIHEFGHNLNLRHNFYGSVDKANFAPATTPVKDAQGNVVIGPNGQPELHPAISSSVMDYHRLEHEMFTGMAWEPYDVAALKYAYSEGKMDDGVKYLFCTDEHTLTGALCNRFDFGSTPTEIVMSFIDAYENGYYTRNYRFGRAYWSTAGYAGGIYTTMQEIKQMLPMWRTGFYDSLLRDELKAKGYSKEAGDQMITEINREMKKAMRLSIAFYQAVLQQSNSDKPFRSEYDEFTGALKRIGIGFDKQAAMFFLAGDNQLFYNPNRILLYSSYMTYRAEPELASLMEKVNENIVTQRVDMEPWFISFGRQLYAQSAMNYSNREDESFINRIKIKRYSAFELGQYFEYQPSANLVADLISLPQSKDADFQKGEQVAIVRVNSHYYVFSKQGSPFAYDIYKNIKQSEDFESPSVEGKLDLQELYYIYTLSNGGTL